MSKQLILAVDQGTSSTKALLVDESLMPLASASVEVSIESPQTGWVQQDAVEIFDSVERVIGQLFEVAANQPDWQIVGLAITNQRESAVAWDSKTGLPVGPMLGWQDRRTEARLHRFDDATKRKIRNVTGLGLDPMFSALKFAWLLDEHDADRSLSVEGRLMLGTLDSYLRFRLTGNHEVEVGNASRTQLLDIWQGDWSADLCELFSVPSRALPTVRASDHESSPIQTGPASGLKILATLADSHAALYAHSLGSKQKINAKATFGTGSSIMAAGELHLEADAIEKAGLVSTIAWGLTGKPIFHGVEGNIISSGSTLVWLGELLGRSVSELAQLAQSVASSGGVNLVPAFSGLGAPWWKSGVTGEISGLTMSTGVSQIARAGFEAVVLQIEDVVAALEQAIGLPLHTINVDGGPTSNAWLMQLLADLSQREIQRTEVAELSAIGVAALAGAKVWQQLPTPMVGEFHPELEPALAKERQSNWAGAVKQVIESARN